MVTADKGLKQLGQKVDTLITIENDRLLSSLNGAMSLERGFRIADEVLRQGVEGISEIVTVPGTINVDFADVKSVMMNRGISFMALGEGKGRTAAAEAVDAALANPLFTAPIEGAQGILFNVRGGRDLSIGQVHEIAGMVEGAAKTQAQVVFGVRTGPAMAQTGARNARRYRHSFPRGHCEREGQRVSCKLGRCWD